MMQRRLIAKGSATGSQSTAARRLLKDFEVEAQYGLSKFTLRADRIHERRFKFIKIGRSVYYRVEDIESVLDRYAVNAATDPA